MSRSLLEGLTKEEREENIYLVRFIITDTVLISTQPSEQSKCQRESENDQGASSEKALSEHTYWLKHCTGVDAPYILLNDDVITLERWYHGT